MFENVSGLSNKKKEVKVEKTYDQEKMLNYYDEME